MTDNAALHTFTFRQTARCKGFRPAAGDKGSKPSWLQCYQTHTFGLERLHLLLLLLTL